MFVSPLGFYALINHFLVMSLSFYPLFVSCLGFYALTDHFLVMCPSFHCVCLCLDRQLSIQLSRWAARSQTLDRTHKHQSHITTIHLDTRLKTSADKAWPCEKANLQHHPHIHQTGQWSMLRRLLVRGSQQHVGGEHLPHSPVTEKSDYT